MFSHLKSFRLPALVLCAVAAAAALAGNSRESFSTSDAAPAGQPLVVHEWGTFTSLQDETGTNLAAINSDDEPVPAFVHRLTPGLALARTPALLLGKGVPKRVPDVTMRLETPVLYFHPPAGSKEMRVDVRVQFRGGWLTEFFPRAAFEAPGFTGAPTDRITAKTSGELIWKDLVIGATGEPVKTNAPVWLAPRAVDAAMVRGESGETEKYLFYRGVGNVKPPVRVVRDAQRDALEVRDERNEPFRMGWLVSIREDGALAFQDAPTQPQWSRATEGPVALKLAATFPAERYRRENLGQLRASMLEELQRDGLFRDEAEAMLNTWETAYFKSPGLRFFYLCPRGETDALLPLELSKPAEIERVMVGRIELVTPEQRAVITQIRQRADAEFANVKPAPPAGVPAKLTPAEIAELQKGWAEAMAEYRRLGRFSNALLLDEQARRPSPTLEAHLRRFGL